MSEINEKLFNNELMEQLTKELNQIIPINSKEDAIKYLKKLHDYRHATYKMSEYNGRNFIDILRSSLSVGTDSLYTDELRFLYELIQNIDDCNYKDPSNCKTTIFFDIDKECIVLEYNELGFTTENVFGISSIGNTSKNLGNSKQIEIGEKGIGFKSVFGIAKKVLIQSGYFSFSFTYENFIVPELEYELFSYTPGTKLTLYLEKGSVQNLFKKIMDTYNFDGPLGYLNNNPVLFLNKLTNIQYKCSNGQYIFFGISRNKQEYNNDLTTENIQISFGRKITSNDDDIPFSMTKNVYKFTKQIEYNQEMCQSRYGNDTLYKNKVHHIVAIAPVREKELLAGIKGSVYSFLPTAIKTNVPIIFHLPFKLRKSREEIDHQNYNLWFQHTYQKFRLFVKDMYIQLSSLEPDHIIEYLPIATDNSIIRNSLFEDNAFSLNKTNNKIKNLIPWNMSIDEYPIINFNNSLYSLQNTHTVSKDLDYSTCVEIVKLLNNNIALISNKEGKIQYKNYGIKEYRSLMTEAFIKLIEDIKLTDSLCMLLNKLKEEKLKEINLQEIKFNLSSYQIKIISKYNKILYLIQKNMLNKNKQSIIVLKDSLALITAPTNNPENTFIEKEIKSYKDMSGIGIIKYLTNYKYQKLNLDSSEAYFIIDNTFYYTDLSNNIQNFIDLYKFNKNEKNEKLIAAFITVASINYNFLIHKNDYSELDFIDQLKAHNIAIKKQLGKYYDQLLKFINESRIDNNTFLNEILQNADDCKYNENPKFGMEIENNKYIFTYNELGFTPDNICALTDIGQSTKEGLLGQESTIGEKGIGFKSLFKIADKVEIHSHNFHFYLRDETPTIPEKITDQPYQPGTKLIVYLKSNHKNVEANKLLELILCLRKINNFNFNGTIITKNEIGNHLTVTVNNQCYRYRIFEDNHIKILFKLNPTNNEKGRIYTGLPTSIKVNSPIFINAPFDLDNSRERILKSDLNSEFLKSIKNILINAFDILKDEIKLEIFNYIVNTNLIDVDLKDNIHLVKDLSDKELFFTQNKYIKIKDCVLIQDIEYYLLKQFNDLESHHLKQSDYTKFVRDKMGWFGAKSKTKYQTAEDIIGNSKTKVLLKTDYTFRNMFHDFYTMSIIDDFLIKKFKNNQMLPIKIENNELDFIGTTDIGFYSDEEISEPNLYYIFDDQVLSRDVINRINGYYINEFTEQNKKEFEAKKISRWLDLDLEDRAIKFLTLFNKNQLYFNEIIEYLGDLKFLIPVKTRSGEYKEIGENKEDKEDVFNYSSSLLWTDNNLTDTFIFDNYNNPTQLDGIIVEKEYCKMAIAIGCSNLKDITSKQFIDRFEKIDEFTIKFILDQEFTNKENILIDVINKKMITKKNICNYFYSFTDIIETNNLQKINHALTIPFDPYRIDKISEISFNCYNISFIIPSSVQYDLYDDEELIEELQLALERNDKQYLAGNWFSKETLYTSSLNNTCFIHMKIDDNVKKVIFLNNRCITSHQVLSEIKSILKEKFKISLELNRTITRYSRFLENRITSSDYTLEEAKEISINIPEYNSKNIEYTHEKNWEKNNLCRAFDIKNKIYPGYKNICPLCNNVVNTELTGMRLKRLIDNYNNKRYRFEIICCTNCNDTINYSKEYKINIEEWLKSGELQIFAQVNDNDLYEKNTVRYKFKPTFYHQCLLLKINQKNLDDNSD